MRSEAGTVEEYLESLPEGRRHALKKVREVIQQNIPDGYEEAMNWGMITYQVPLEVYPDTYNGQPLMYAALASQKNHMAVYLTAIYMTEADRISFEEAYRATGKRFDVGKSCVRFKKLEDLPFELIGKTIGSITMNDFVSMVKRVHSPRKSHKK
jgi:uncharacterized protein YdhG (YjbR/CyaY superfamily)